MSLMKVSTCYVHDCGKLKCADSGWFCTEHLEELRSRKSGLAGSETDAKQLLEFHISQRFVPNWGYKLQSPCYVAGCFRVRLDGLLLCSDHKKDYESTSCHSQVAYLLDKNPGWPNQEDDMAKKKQAPSIPNQAAKTPTPTPTATPTKEPLDEMKFSITGNTGFVSGFAQVPTLTTSASASGAPIFVTATSTTGLSPYTNAQAIVGIKDQADVDLLNWEQRNYGKRYEEVIRELYQAIQKLKAEQAAQQDASIGTATGLEQRVETISSIVAEMKRDQLTATSHKADADNIYAQLKSLKDTVEAIHAIKASERDFKTVTDNIYLRLQELRDFVASSEKLRNDQHLVNGATASDIGKLTRALNGLTTSYDRTVQGVSQDVEAIAKRFLENESTDRSLAERIGQLEHLVSEAGKRERRLVQEDRIDVVDRYLAMLSQKQDDLLQKHEALSFSESKAHDQLQKDIKELQEKVLALGEAKTQPLVMTREETIQKMRELARQLGDHGEDFILVPYEPIESIDQIAPAVRRLIRGSPIKNVTFSDHVRAIQTPEGEIFVGGHSEKMVQLLGKAAEQAAKEAAMSDQQQGPQQPTTEQPKPTALQQVEQDAMDAARRLAAKQFLKLVRVPVLAKIGAGVDSATKDKLVAFLDTDLGEALFAGLIGFGLTMLPKMGNIEEAKAAIAKEFRVTAMTDVGLFVTDLLLDPLVTVITTFIQAPKEQPLALPQESVAVTRMPQELATKPELVTTPARNGLSH